MSRFGILLGAALLVRAVLFLYDGYSNDLHRYVWEGRIQWEGYSPYAIAPADAPARLRDDAHARVHHADYPTIYPPLAQALFAAVAGTGLGEAGMRNVVVLLDMAVCALLLLWLRASGRSLAWAGVYLFHPLVLASDATGHVDPLMLLCLVGCCWAWESRRDRSAALLLAGAILAKTVAVLALPWFLLRKPKETLLVTVPVVVLAYLAYGGGDAGASLFRFGTEMAFNASLFRVLDAVAPGHGAIVAGVLLGGWTLAVAGTQPRLPHAFVLLFMGLLALSPTVHTWYLAWALVLLPAVGPRPWTWPYLAWSASAMLVGFTYFPHAGGEPFREHAWVTVVEYLVPAAVALFVAWRYGPRRHRAEAPRAGATGGFGVVIPCRGEVRNLTEMLPRWIDTPAERIVVADTPTDDGTRDLCRGELRIQYLAVKERGYGAAVQAGLERLRGEVAIAIVCDADHVDGPRQAEAILAPFADPDVALVSAARVRSPHLTFAQRFGNRLACFLIALGWGRRFCDLGPYRALRLSRWPKSMLRDKGFGWNVEMNVRAVEAGMTVVEVALPARARPHGRNRISGTWRGVLGAGWGILTRLYALREESCGRPSSS